MKAMKIQIRDVDETAHKAAKILAPQEGVSLQAAREFIARRNRSFENLAADGDGGKNRGDSGRKIELSLQDGMWIAHAFLERVEPITGMGSCEIAGSIRRLRPVVHDIDILFHPLHQSDCRLGELRARCERMPNVEIVKWGPKLAAITYCGTPIDLYFSTPGNFQTLLLIRTGSKHNNIRLCSLAQRKGWKLHASGEGLFNERGERIAGDTERSIYDALGIPWQEPWERN